MTSLLAVSVNQVTNPHWADSILQYMDIEFGFSIFPTHQIELKLVKMYSSDRHKFFI